MKIVNVHQLNTPTPRKKNIFKGRRATKIIISGEDKHNKMSPKSSKVRKLSFKGAMETIPHGRNEPSVLNSSNSNFFSSVKEPQYAKLFFTKKITRSQ
jgi:hypothetical protein